MNISISGFSAKTIQKQEDFQDVTVSHHHARGTARVDLAPEPTDAQAPCRRPPAGGGHPHDGPGHRSNEAPPPAAPATTPPTATKARPAGLPAYTGGAATLRFAWWGNDDRAARTKKVIDLFQAAYPQIKVTGEPNGATADHFQISTHSSRATTPPT